MIPCNIYGLLLGFLVGVCITTIISEEPNIVIKYPTPHNIKETTYINEAGNCYKYEANKIKCPKDKRKINDLPIQN